METLRTLEQEEDIDPCEYLDFLTDPKEIEKFHKKYRLIVSHSISSPRSLEDLDRPNGSYAFRMD
jgi:hypothetical protein